MIEICEVGPRDGLQNEAKQISTDVKVELIERLIDAGVRNLEVASFVNPKVVPQMADAEEVLKRLPDYEDVRYTGLVLSQSGVKRALETKVDVVNTAITASNEFNLKNVRRTVDENLAELVNVLKTAKGEGKGIAGIIGTAFGCPYEGEIPVDQVLHVAEGLVEAGCYELTLADTTGLANPFQVRKVVNSVKGAFGNDISLGLHFHNTRGLGLANTLAGYEEGVRRFDSSIAGLGGCPFAPKAVGNVCTEDMVHMFHEMGKASGTDLEKLVATAQWFETYMERPLDGMVMKAGTA
ncbi:hydroxymethylglutaryl-CoA lyase [Salimicrobium halophilum]|uniref:Hydroxymethylglutaryl-CoA lyase n=1 Tax=Salimicrobium halophilum TaxID=86666 RepID=A0A1G8SCD3_9BACI|nr:hydroxymethylglutaryl-CoA lyase [Salimicrobium halophilum]SDJ26909.1 hydroxymethylglutaryl-CoA lyase [Salimicrobium halophilum]